MPEASGAVDPARASPPLRELMRREVHLWLARPEGIQDPALLAKYSQLLTPEERARGARFRFRRHGDQYLITRALVRTRLSHYFDVDPADWRFVPGEHGRPRIERPLPDGAHEPRGLSFNLSHTDGLIACAISFGAVIGCDVESLDRKVGGDAIAKRFFAPSERALMDATPEPERSRRFLQLWTLKESYLKACGTGLRTPLESFSFGLAAGVSSAARSQDGSISIRFDGLDDLPERWQFRLLEPDPAHVLAIALASPTPASLRIRECVPLADPA